MKRLISKKGLENAYRVPKEEIIPEELSNEEYMDAIEALPSELFEIISAVVLMLEQDDTVNKEEKK